MSDSLISASLVVIAITNLARFVWDVTKWKFNERKLHRL